MESIGGTWLKRVAHYGWFVLLLGGVLSSVSPFAAWVILPQFFYYPLPVLAAPDWLAAVYRVTVLGSPALVGLAFCFLLFDFFVHRRWFDWAEVRRRSLIKFLSIVVLAIVGAGCSIISVYFLAYSVSRLHDELVVNDVQYLLVHDPNIEGWLLTDLYVCQPGMECAYIGFFGFDCDPYAYKLQPLDDGVMVVCGDDDAIFDIYLNGSPPPELIHMLQQGDAAERLRVIEGATQGRCWGCIHLVPYIAENLYHPDSKVQNASAQTLHTLVNSPGSRYSWQVDGAREWWETEGQYQDWE